MPAEAVVEVTKFYKQTTTMYSILGVDGLMGAAKLYIYYFFAAAGAGLASGAWSILSLNAFLSMSTLILVVSVAIAAYVAAYIAALLKLSSTAVGAWADALVVGSACAGVMYFMSGGSIEAILLAVMGGGVGSYVGDYLAGRIPSS